MSNISWFIKSDGEYKMKKKYEAGTFSIEDDIAFDIQVWNNRWGIENTNTIETPVVEIFFKHTEDSSLLENVEVYEREKKIPFVKTGKKGMAILSQELSGRANDGDENESINRFNFINLKIVIKKEGELKENDLKSMIINISDLS